MNSTIHSSDAAKHAEHQVSTVSTPAACGVRRRRRRAVAAAPIRCVGHPSFLSQDRQHDDGHCEALIGVQALMQLLELGGRAGGLGVSVVQRRAAAAPK